MGQTHGPERRWFKSSRQRHMRSQGGQHAAGTNIKEGESRSQTARTERALLPAGSIPALRTNAFPPGLCGLHAGRGGIPGAARDGAELFHFSS